MPHCGVIALAGAPNVGKSSLLNALVGEHLAIVSPKAQATRLPVVGLVTSGDTQFVFQDLPGLLEPAYLLQTRMREAALAQLARANVVLHLHPAPEAPAPPLIQVARLPSPPAAPVVTVYTKADLVTPERRTSLATDALIVSAEQGAGLDDLLSRVGALLPEAPFAFDPDDIGTQPLRFFATEYLREAAFELLGDEVPYALAAEIEEFREDRDPMYIRASLFIERESQKGIVIGRGGITLKAIGVHARQRLEALTGRRVFLETWVKVLPKWRRDSRALSRFGFPADTARKETP